MFMGHMMRCSSMLLTLQPQWGQVVCSNSLRNLLCCISIITMQQQPSHKMHPLRTYFDGFREKVEAQQIMRLDMQLVEQQVFYQLQKGQLSIQRVVAKDQSHPHYKFLTPGEHDKLVTIRRMENEAQARRREQIAEHEAQKQQEIDEEQRKKQTELKLMDKEQRRRRAQLAIQQFHQRQAQRRAFDQASDNELVRINNSTLLYQKLEKQFQNDFILPIKQKERLALQPFRNRLKPMNHGILKEHERFFMQIKHEVTESHKKEIRQHLNQPIYRPPFKLKVAERVKEEMEKAQQDHYRRKEESEERLKKVMEFNDMVKKYHMPSISENSSFKASNFISKPRTSTRSHHQLGKEYLSQLRQQHMSERDSRASLHSKQSSQLMPIDERSKSERKVLDKKNFLQKHTQKELQIARAKKLQNLMTNCETNKEEVGQLVVQLQKIDRQLRRRGEFNRIVHGKEDPQLAGQYLQNLGLKISTLEKL